MGWILAGIAFNHVGLLVLDVGKKADNARSSQLTGGEGFTYEDVVAAYFLAALLREEAALGQPGYVARVAVQQDRQGEPMDDIIVDSEAAGGRSRLSLQVKRSVTINKANEDFNQIIANAIATRAKPGFRPSLDRYGFIVRRIADGRFQSLLRIIDRARASTTGAEFANRFQPAGESSKETQNPRRRPSRSDVKRARTLCATRAW